MDYGHRESDRRLRELETKISKEYKQAFTKIKAKSDEYFKRFEKSDKEMSQKLKQKQISKQEYLDWRRKVMAKGDALKDLEDNIVEVLFNADKVANKLIKNHNIGVYALNRNYGEYEVCKGAKMNISFSIYDEKTVERLLKKDPDLLPVPKLDEKRDKKWNKQKVNSAVTQGIIQGDSIPNIAKRLQVTVGMGTTSSIRNARTATTGAENAGRIDSYKDAENMGIELEKQWMATLDMRTRVSHRQLDGQSVGIDEKFKVDGEEIDYPGDPEAEGYLVYNCRCTLVANIKNIEYKDDRWSRLPEGMSYEEWVESKPVYSKKD